MYIQPEPDLQVDRYTGPYERWVFSEALGKPFAFPAISEGTSPFFTALLEGGQQLPSGDAIEARLPPLWPPSDEAGAARSVTPFAFHSLAESSETQTDTQLAEALSVLNAGSRESAGLEPRFRVNFPITPEAWAIDYQPDQAMAKWAKPEGSAAPSAIVAVIDDGLPFAHRAFLNASGKTRISHLWMQSATSRDQEAVPFGRELKNSEIDALRAKHGLDEAALYRDEEAGAIDADSSELGTHIRRHATHGAHVMGVAAGNDSRLSSHPMPDDVLIIAVQLPNSISWDTSGFGKDMYMLSALHYIFNRARAISDAYGCGELPLVVNLSYGWSASRHDGKSQLEEAMEELLSARKAAQPASAIVMPMGNNFGKDMHGQITAQDMSNGSYSFGWHVQPDDRTSSYLEMWLPEGRDYEGFTVTVTPPQGSEMQGETQIEISPDPDLSAAGDAAPSGDPRRFAELTLPDGQVIGQLSADKDRGTRWRVMLALIPTVYTRGQTRRAPSGQWKITLSQGMGEALNESEAINVWVQRDDDPVSLRTGGRQSRLVDLTEAPRVMPHPLKDYDGQLGFLRSYGCYNGVSSAPSVTRVAGYTASTRRPSAYSGAHGLSRAPDGSIGRWSVSTSVAAVADRSRLVAGTQSIGVLSGSSSWLVGTSGAAPQVARLMALNAAQGAPLDHGFDASLPMAGIEDDIDMTRAKHAARVGAKTAPPVGRGARTDALAAAAMTS